MGCIDPLAKQAILDTYKGASISCDLDSESLPECCEYDVVIVESTLSFAGVELESLDETAQEDMKESIKYSFHEKTGIPLDKITVELESGSIKAIMEAETDATATDAVSKLTTDSGLDDLGGAVFENIPDTVKEALPTLQAPAVEVKSTQKFNSDSESRSESESASESTSESE